MLVSIALATFNGEPYVRQQIESLLSQSRLPDEIIISDDGSVDATLSIIEEYKAQSSVPIKLLRNTQRLGIAQNFTNALEHTVGDLILLCDQDDIWKNDKVAFYEDYFRKNIKVHLMLSDAEIFPNNNKNKHTKIDYFKRNNKTLSYFCTGCCMGFTRDFLNIALPIPTDVAHDVWFNEVAKALGTRHVCNKVTMQYRRHEANNSSHISSSTEPVNLFQKVRKDIEKLRQSDSLIVDVLHAEALIMHFERLIESDAPEIINLYQEVISKLKKELTCHLDRCRRREYRTFMRMLTCILAYSKGEYQTYNGFQSLMRDIAWRKKNQ